MSRCVEELNNEYERYYRTVRITLTLKKALEKYNIENIHFLQAEYSMKSVTTSRKLKPDVALEESNGRLLLIEIKSSLPDYEEFLKQELLELKKYDEDLIRFDKKGEISKDHDLIFLCPYREYEAVQNMIIKLGKEFYFSKNFSIWTWADVDALKSGATNSIVIERKTGTVKNPQLNSASVHININELDLIKEGEKSVFVPVQPPDVYLLVRLFSQIFPGIFSQKEKTFISIDEIVETAKSYYISWAGNEGVPSQIRSTWIKKGLKLLEELDLAEINDSGEYFIQHWLPKRAKDTREYLIRTICEKKLPKKETELEEKRKRELLKKQKQLDEFLT